MYHAAKISQIWKAATHIAERFRRWLVATAWPQGSTGKPSFVGNVPTPRFYQPLRGNPTSTGGCLRGGRRLLSNKRSFS